MCELRDGVGRAERLVVLGERHFQRIGNRPSLDCSDQVGRLPAEHLRGEAGKVAGSPAEGRFSPSKVTCSTHVEEAGVVGDDVLVGERSGGGQRRRRDDQADRLEVAEPFYVR